MTCWLWRRRGEEMPTLALPTIAVDHAAERAAAVDALKQSQAALEDAIRTRQETRAVAEELRRHRTANRFAERIAESFRE